MLKTFFTKMTNGNSSTNLPAILIKKLPISQQTNLYTMYKLFSKIYTTSTNFTEDQFRTFMEKLKILVIYEQSNKTLLSNILTKNDDTTLSVMVEVIKHSFALMESPKRSEMTDDQKADLIVIVIMGKLDEILTENQHY